MANPENKQIPYESTQKDIRDAIESVATAIGGIAIPSADHVSYDNSGSGLSATDVQNALDEIVSDIPTVNNGTLTIQQNGTSIGSFSANTASNVTANIKTPTADKKTATTEFNTANGGLLSKCMIDLVPVQSGSGDPYPAGGGKNKLPLVLADIKSANTSGVWSGNTYTIYTTTFTILTDDWENVLGIKVNGKSVGGNAIFYLHSYSFDGTSITLNGCPSGGSSSTYRLDAFGDFLAQDIGSGVNITNAGNVNIRIVIFENVTVSNIIFYPMLRLSTETDPTFAPYSNVRPISGHTEVDLDVKDGDNVTQHTYQVQIGSTVYGGYVDLVSGVMVVDRKSLDLGSQSWVIASTNTTGKYRMFTALSSDYAKAVGSEQISNAVCDIFKTISAGQTYRLNDGVSVNGSQIIIYDKRYDTSSSASDFTTAMNGHQLVYELATPITIQLTPQQIETLVGQNNLSTPLDGQSIETNGVEYKELFTFADVKEYVDKKIPDAPTTDGTYTLQAVVSGGVPTYSWV